MWYYAIVGAGGSTVGMGRLLLAIGAALVLALLVVGLAFG